jgi:hypothetical protein
MRLTSTGLGIGTSSPSRQIEVSSVSSSVVQQITSPPNDTATIAFGDLNSTNKVHQRVGSRGNSLTFITADTERMRLDDSGNLGIGTSSPSYKLDVQTPTSASARIFSTAAASGTATLYLNVGNNFSGVSQAYIQGIGSGVSGASQIAFGTAGAAGDVVATERMRLDSSGNLGLGVTPTSGWSNYRALQIGQFGLLAYNFETPSTEIGQNYYYNGTNYIAVTSGTAARFVVNNGNTAGFAWYSASATAGNAISFTQAATLTANGEYLVGLTSATGVAKLQVSGPLQTTGYTVATLPTGTVGMRTYVTDALIPVALATVAGGGSVVVPVFYNGSNWIVA